MLGAFPRIAHLQGSHAAPDDLRLPPEAERQLLCRPVVVYEKLDGINVAIGRDRHGLQLAVREPWASALGGAVVRAVDIYVRQRAAALLELLGPRDVAYGEWLWHRVSTRYAALPDLLVLFALRRSARWLPAASLRQRVARVGLTGQQPLWHGVPHDTRRLLRLLGPSALGAPRMEGLVVERAGEGAAPRWAKWVARSYRHVEPGALSGERNTLR